MSPAAKTLVAFGRYYKSLVAFVDIKRVEQRPGPSSTPVLVTGKQLAVSLPAVG